MKFVHLTPRRNIGLIKKHGLRMGNGRLGRGLYAMPLIGLPWEYWLLPNEWAPPTVSSEPVSTSRSWRRELFRWNSSRGTKAAAIVFTLPAPAWPVRLFISMSSDVGLAFLDWVKRSDGSHLMSPEELRLASDALSKSAWYHLVMKVGSAKRLGQIFHAYLAAGGKQHWLDDIEVLIETPIPPSCIERVVPYYQSNAEFKSRRGLARHRREDEAI